MTLISSNIFAQDGLVRFSIDKALFEQMSDSQKSSLITRTQELNQFIERDVKKHIPSTIQQKIQNLKIKISLTNEAGRDGLFIPQENGEHVIQIQLIQINTNGIKALLAHEIYHAIHFSINPNELPWVREGMAQVFEFITTGALNGANLYAAITNPLTPLLGEYSPEEKSPAQYGHNQLYFYYLYSHCGEKDFFWKMTVGKDGQKGSYLVDEVLKELSLQRAECRDFSESALSFEVAKIHNQMQFLNADQMNRYYLYQGDITPRFKPLLTLSDLEQTLRSMPVLSSYKIPMEDFIKMNVSLPNFALFYASNTFPYDVTEALPKSTKSVSVIIVKLRKE